ncbi:dodecin family protein [Jannaschia sp. M317]|nr:dodecin family protein [Jannaschia sp. M317]
MVRVTKISATCTASIEDAVAQRAYDTLRNVQSAWVKEHSVHVTDSKVDHYQGNMMVTFILED